MLVHDGDRAFGVARTKRIDDLLVFVDRAIGRVRPAVEGEDQRAARNQLREVARQQAVFRQLGEYEVELAGKPDRDAMIAGGRASSRTCPPEAPELRSPPLEQG